MTEPVIIDVLAVEGTPDIIIDIGEVQAGDITIDVADQGVAGPPGPTGPTGPAGPVGPAGPAINEDWVRGRGGELVTNFNGYQLSNNNWSTTTFTQADKPDGAVGAFITAVNSSNPMDEFIAINPKLRYHVGAYCKDPNATGTTLVYMYFRQYDVDGLLIDSNHVMYRANTLTTLTADLKPGDTVAHLASTANWINSTANTYERAFIVWNYVDGKGYAWPAQTYSRRSYQNVYDNGAIVGNDITLRVPWAGPLIPAGTQLSNGSQGSSAAYVAWVGVVLTNQWLWRDTAPNGVGGINPTGTGFTSGYFCYGCVKVKVGFLGTGGAAVRFSGVTFHVAEALYAGNGITLDSLSTPGATWINATAAVSKVDNYTVPGAYTWTKPSGAKMVQVIVQAPGGGGGSGGRGGTTVSRGGGSGGGGGGRTVTWFSAADLGATVSITVGAGGAGGAAVGADNTVGNPGVDGGRSRFGTTPGTPTTWYPWPGAAGQGGKIDGTTTPSSSGPIGSNPSTGQGAGTTGVASLPHSTFTYAAAAGAGGGGLTTGNAAQVGGSSYGTPNAHLYTLTAGGAGGVAGTNGPSVAANFPATSEPWPPGLGGTGGGSGSAGVGGNGGDGVRGGGGGGGGASANGFASGAGGKGGDGYVQVITYF